MKESSTHHSSSDEQKEKSALEPDAPVFRYADEYHRAVAREERKLIEIKRDLLFAELKGYQRFLPPASEARQPKTAWTPFQKTINYAAHSARDHLDGKTPFEAAVATRMEMRAQGLELPRGAAEWIVQNVSRSSTEDQTRPGESEDASMDSDDIVPDEVIPINPQFLP